MKIFANKNIWKKLVLVLLFITLFSFVAPQPVAANIGGELMRPICDFLVTICDGIVNIFHRLLVKQQVTIIQVDLDEGGWQKALKVVATVAAVVGIVALIVSTGGLAGVGIGVLLLIKTSGVALIVLAGALYSKSLQTSVGEVTVTTELYSFEAWELDEIDLPLYTVSPEEIFKNQVPIFNVNFFDPDMNEYNSVYSSVNNNSLVLPDESEFSQIASANTMYSDPSIVSDKINEQLANNGYGIRISEDMEITNAEVTLLEEDTDLSGSGKTYYYSKNSGDHVGTYRIEASDNEARISTQVYWTSTSAYQAGTDDEGYYTMGKELSEVISAWYYRLLVIAAVGMLTVLVYVGIRILISSTASDKAKYKQMLGDWLVGMILLFTLHYIMVFANTFVDLITDFLGSADQGFCSAVFQDEDEKIQQTLDEAGFYSTTEYEARKCG